MFWKVLMTIGLLTVLILCLPGCSSNNLPNTPISPGGIKASLGQEFKLPVGQTAAITGEDLKLKFDGVTADSRCPKGVQCIWAGEAKVQLSITNNNSTSQVIYTLPGGAKAVGQDFFNLYKANFELEPYPEANKQIAATDYQLIMTISKGF
jgi:hypothetical protein